MVAPLPFRIKLPAEESYEFTGYREVVTTVEGLLHLEAQQLVVEWAMRRKTEEVGLLGVSDETEAFEPEELVIPLDWISKATLEGGILSPRLVLHGRGLRVFGDIPGTKGATLPLPYARTDRLVAATMARAITHALAQPRLEPLTPLPE